MFVWWSSLVDKDEMAEAKQVPYCIYFPLQISLFHPTTPSKWLHGACWKWMEEDSTPSILSPFCLFGKGRGRSKRGHGASVMPPTYLPVSKQVGQACSKPSLFWRNELEGKKEIEDKGGWDPEKLGCHISPYIDLGQACQSLIPNVQAQKHSSDCF